MILVCTFGLNFNRQSNCFVVCETKNRSVSTIYSMQAFISESVLSVCQWQLVAWAQCGENGLFLGFGWFYRVTGSRCCGLAPAAPSQHHSAGMNLPYLPHAPDSNSELKSIGKFPPQVDPKLRLTFTPPLPHRHLLNHSGTVIQHTHTCIRAHPHTHTPQPYTATVSMSLDKPILSLMRFDIAKKITVTNSWNQLRPTLGIN